MIEAKVRPAAEADMLGVARLLREFNREFGDAAPPAAWLAERIARLVEGGDTLVLIVGEAPDGLAVLRFRESIWIPGPECYLAELYVVPEKRGRGLGRALMLEALRHARVRGAGYIDLNTNERDVAACRLYESLGFDNFEGKQDGARSLYYELEL
jgi:ribosomal protein S18 acetylase RimI-like enzyme